MKYEIKVPVMGESITEATVGEILKATGSVVTMDEEILELETDKVNQVLYAPESGTLSLDVSTDDVVKIGQVIGHVDSSGASGKASSSATGEQVPKQDQASKEEKEPAAPGKAPNEEKEEAPKASVLGHASRVSKEDYLNSVVSGTKAPEQTEKPIFKEPSSVLPATTAPKQEAYPAPKEERRETRRRMTKIRRVIAQKLVEAKQSTAMLTTFNEVDLSAVMDLREKYKDYFSKEYGVKLGFMSFFVKASVSALMAFPDVNSYIDGEEIVHREYYDIGIAVGTEKGLIVPVVRGCEKLSFAEVERSIVGFANKAREGNISLDDLQGGGFTITNGGTYGSLLSTPILNPPQSAILGMHKIEKRPVVVNDEIVIRPMMYLALSYDHRIIDGKEAVSFLIHIKNCLEDPSRLLLGV